jgi:hypothetical protein
MPERTWPTDRAEKQMMFKFVVAPGRFGRRRIALFS